MKTLLHLGVVNLQSFTNIRSSAFGHQWFGLVCFSCDIVWFMAAAVNSVLNKREIADGTCCEIYSKDDFLVL